MTAFLFALDGSDRGDEDDCCLDNTAQSHKSNTHTMNPPPLISDRSDIDGRAFEAVLTQ